MKSIEVVAAIIIKDHKIFTTQRGYGEFENYWEFPGGKIEIGESQKDALKREIKEEIDADISIDKFALKINYNYPTFHLTMHCYLCSLLSDFTLLEHKKAKWLSKDEIDFVKWLPADIEVVNYIKNEVFG